MPSDLPIITPDPPKRSQAERYGTLYYLGIAGLVTVVALVAWFGLGLWSLRGYFADVYALHDPARSEEDRVNAALSLSRSDRPGERQYWDDALDRRLPELARYLMAESLSAEATATDPRGYALSAARSEGWPDWLRVLVARPMAYAAGPAAHAFPPEALIELRSRPDPILRLWASYIQAISGDAPARADLSRAAGEPGPNRALAASLVEALDVDGDRRLKALDRATSWLRSHHPDALKVWNGWEFREDRLRKKPGA